MCCVGFDPKCAQLERLRAHVLRRARVLRRCVDKRRGVPELLRALPSFPRNGSFLVTVRAQLGRRPSATPKGSLSMRLASCALVEVLSPYTRDERRNNVRTFPQQLYAFRRPPASTRPRLFRPRLICFPQAGGGLKNDFECDDMVLNDQTIGNLLSR